MIATARRRVLRVLLLVALLGALSLSSARPSHAENRYLDEVFASVDVTSNIPYGESIDEFGQPETLLLDLYEPAGDTLQQRPVLIFIHGGGFTGGSKTNPSIVQYVTSFAERGYVTASISYRLREGGFSEAEAPYVVLDAQHDAQAAVRWFRANAATYRIDTNRISIGGYSAGAYTALFATYNQGDVGDSGNPGYPSDVSAVIDVSGGLFDPLMEAGEPPAMVVHGTADATVSYNEALELDARGEEVGVEVELHTLTGVGHGKFSSQMNNIVLWSSEFLYEYVIANSVGGVAELPAAAHDALLTSEMGRAFDDSAVAIAVVAALLLVGVATLRARRRRASR